MQTNIKIKRRRILNESSTKFNDKAFSVLLVWAYRQTACIFAHFSLVAVNFPPANSVCYKFEVVTDKLQLGFWKQEALSSWERR